MLLFELGHHRFPFFRRRVSHFFFGGGSMSLVTATDLLHDMVVALFPISSNEFPVISASQGPPRSRQINFFISDS